MSTDRTIGDEMAGDASWAAHLLHKGWDVELDFSEASIARVEEVCEQLYDFVDEEERDVAMYSRYLGAYIGEVFRRVVGGEWVIHSDKLGQVPAVRCGDLTIFPHDKVRKRLVDGPRDNLFAYFEVFKGQASGGRPTHGQ